MDTKKEDNMRPWGFYENLADTRTHKVKRITVYPGKRLSLQSHTKREEHWYVVQGSSILTLDDKCIEFRAGQSADIGKGVRHRVANTGKEDLVFIEVQTGDYFGEDDIVRYEDDYGRVDAR